MKTTDKPIKIKQQFETTVTNVWSTITDTKLMQQWFFTEIPDFKPEIGFETKFTITVGNREFKHIWKIIDVIPNKKITYHWSYFGYQGAALVDFELFESNDNCTLQLSNTVIENFPENVPEFTRQSCKAGWEYFIQQNLNNFIIQSFSSK